MFARSMLSSLVLVLSLMLNACASDPSKPDRVEQRQAQYNSHAGAPVKQIRMLNLYAWTAIDREQLVLWTTPRDAFLIDLFSPCLNLDFAQAIGVSNLGRTIYAGFDSIVVGGERCRIRQIRPIDSKALKAERKTQRESAKLQDR